MNLTQRIEKVETAKRALLDLDAYDTISYGTAFETIIMQENELKKEYVRQRHNGEIKKKSRNKNGKKIEYWWAEVANKNGGYSQVTSMTEDGLYSKLYDFYTNAVSAMVTLKDAYVVWHRQREHDAKVTRTISGRTWDDDEDSWNRFWDKSSLAKMKIKAITTRDILQECKAITGNGKFTEKAFGKGMNCLNLIFDMLLDEGIVTINLARQVPTTRLKFKAGNDNEGIYYNREERDTLLQYLYDLNRQTVYSLAVSLTACLGKRLGEVRAITWDDYNPQKRTLRIGHQMVLDYADMNSKSKTTQDVDHLKSYQKAQVIPLSDYAVFVLEELRKINGNKPYILNSAGKLPIESSHFNEHLRGYCEACGITYYSSHKFRFYGASEMYEQGIPEEQISAFLNHANVETTRMYDRRVKKGISFETAEAVFGFTPA